MCTTSSSSGSFEASGIPEPLVQTALTILGHEASQSVSLAHCNQKLQMYGYVSKHVFEPAISVAAKTKSLLVVAQSVF